MMVMVTMMEVIIIMKVVMIYVMMMIVMIMEVLLYVDGGLCTQSPISSLSRFPFNGEPSLTAVLTIFLIFVLNIFLVLILVILIKITTQCFVLCVFFICRLVC